MKILQVCHKPPYPSVDGGSIAMYNLAKGLMDSGHIVHVIAMNTYKQYCEIEKVSKSYITDTRYTLVDVDIRIKILPAFLNLFSNRSYNIQRFDTNDFMEKLINIIARDKYDMILLESLYVTPYIDAIRNIFKGLIVLRSHNTEFRIWENLCKNESNIFKKEYLRLLAKRLKRYEINAIKKVDFIASISEQDNDIFKKEGCETNMEYIPFGIDFTSSEFITYSEPKVDELILFHLGSMDWRPHQEAFKWFFERVWLELHKKYPALQLHLAGSKMPGWIKKGNYPNVFVTNSYVNGKLFMQKKTLMIVPSFSGSGIRVKIAEGMAKGKVIITTSNGLTGIPATNKENLFVADNEQEWVTIISNCIENFNLVQNVSRKARQFAELEFDHILCAKKLIECINKLHITTKVSLQSQTEQ